MVFDLLIFLFQVPQLVVFPDKTYVTMVACHPEGKHFMALSSGGDVYSWGNGDGGKLGHGDPKYCLCSSVAEYTQTSLMDSMGSAAVWILEISGR